MLILWYIGDALYGQQRGSLWKEHRLFQRLFHRSGSERKIGTIFFSQVTKMVADLICRALYLFLSLGLAVQTIEDEPRKGQGQRVNRFLEECSLQPRRTSPLQCAGVRLPKESGVSSRSSE